MGDPSKAKAELGWEPEITAQEMCKEMVEEDPQLSENHAANNVGAAPGVKPEKGCKKAEKELEAK